MPSINTYAELAIKVPVGRFKLITRRNVQFYGAFDTYESAMAAAQRLAVPGYNHASVVPVSFELMCRMWPWDYPILYWLQKLLPDHPQLIDAGGHLGTKYTAFRDKLQLKEGLGWTVYELPEMVKAGRERARREGLEELRFSDIPEELPACDVFLGSGLLQYLDMPFPTLLGRLPRLPQHLLLNKVSTREDRHVVTLERIGQARVPYQMRLRPEFLSSVQSLGYELVDEWQIPSFSHWIDTHPELGPSTSRGYYFRQPAMAARLPATEARRSRGLLRAVAAA